MSVRRVKIYFDFDIDDNGISGSDVESIQFRYKRIFLDGTVEADWFVDRTLTPTTSSTESPDGPNYYEDSSNRYYYIIDVDITNVLGFEMIYMASDSSGNDSNWSDGSDGSGTGVSNLLLPIPTNLEISIQSFQEGDTSARAIASWEDSDPNVTNYELKVSGSAQIVEQESGTDILNLEFGAPYLFVIEATRTDGSVVTEAVTVTIPYQVPSQPELTITFLSIGAGDLDVTANATWMPTLHTKEYLLECNGGVVQGHEPNTNITNLEFATEYTFRVTSIGYGGDKRSDILTIKTPAYFWTESVESELSNKDRTLYSIIEHPIGKYTANSLHLFDLPYSDTISKIIVLQGKVEAGINGIKKVELGFMRVNDTLIKYFPLEIGLDGSIVIALEDVGPGASLFIADNRIQLDLESGKYLTYIRVRDNFLNKSYSQTQTFVYRR